MPSRGVVLLAATFWSLLLSSARCETSDRDALDRRVLAGGGVDYEVFDRTLQASKGSAAGGSRASSRTNSSSQLQQQQHAVTSPTNRVPAYSPPDRNTFTPPLPQERYNPFADKPTLRGSHSEDRSTQTQLRRPAGGVVVRAKEFIPVRPVDVPTSAVDAKKKTINTPSLNKLRLPESAYSEPASTTAANGGGFKGLNDTYSIVVQQVQNLSSPNVFRILFDNENGKKMDVGLGNDKPNLDADLKPSRTVKQEPARAAPSVQPTETTSSSPPPQTYEPTSEETTEYEPSSFKEQQVTESRNDVDVPESSRPEIVSMPDHPEPRARYILGVFWDVHVYLIAILFLILVFCSAVSIVRIRAFKKLLTCGYFVTVHGLLIVIGCVRSAYLLYDPYNVNGTLSVQVSGLALNIVFPLLLTVYSVLFLFLLRTTDVKTVFYNLQKSSLLAIFVSCYMAFCVIVLFYSDAHILSLVSKCVYILLCVILGSTYVCLYRSMSNASLRKQGTVFGASFHEHRPTLAHSVRVTLATSMLSLLMAAVQLYGMVGVYEMLGKDQPNPWLWWGYQFSVRVIEISSCFLIFWASVQPLRYTSEKEAQNQSGLTLFPCRGTVSRSDPPSDDIYPAICSANQAVHNYTLRTGKHIYDDTYSMGGPPLANHQLFAHTTERRSLKQHDDDSRSMYAYAERAAIQPSPSMLVAENGFVRFRSLADERNPEDQIYPIKIHHHHRDNCCT